MYPYLIIYAIAAVAACITRLDRINRLLAGVFAVVLVVFIGTRLDVGCDTSAYFERFQHLYIGMGWWEALVRGEGIFNWLNMGLIYAGLPFQVLVFACGLIFVAGLGRFSTLAPSPLSFMVLSFPILIVQLGMSGMRQASATGFLMIAFVSFVKKQRLQTAAWIVVASQFHTSAIVFLPMVFMIGRHVTTKRLLIVMALLGPVVVALLGQRFSVYTDRYVDKIYGENSAEGAWPRYALVLIPFLAMQWKQRLISERFPAILELLRLFMFISFAMLPIGLASTVVLHRMTFYAMPVANLAMLYFVQCVFDRWSERIGALVPFLIYGTYILAWFMFSRHAHSCYVPYESILF